MATPVTNVAPSAAPTNAAAAVVTQPSKFVDLFCQEIVLRFFSFGLFAIVCLFAATSSIASRRFLFAFLFQSFIALHLHSHPNWLKRNRRQFLLGRRSVG